MESSVMQTPSLDELLTHDKWLPTLPAIYFRVKKIVDDPDGAQSELAKVIGADPGLTARIMRMVNSPLYVVPGRVTTIAAALRMLGMLRVHDLVLATSVAQTFAGVPSSVMDVTRFWRHSVFCSLAARAIANRCGILDLERLFVEGLLANIGNLVLLARVPGEASLCLRSAQSSGSPLHTVQRELLGYDYALVGRRLLEKWNLPVRICDTVGDHLSPGPDMPHATEASILHIATAIAATEDASTLDERAATVEAAAWEVTGLGIGHLAEIHAEAKADLTGVVASMATI